MFTGGHGRALAGVAESGGRTCVACRCPLTLLPQPISIRMQSHFLDIVALKKEVFCICKYTNGLSAAPLVPKDNITTNLGLCYA
jgi:hypothetical protein